MFESDIFGISILFYLSGLIAAALFLAGTGIRYLKADRFEGLVYIGLSFFFIVAHLIFLNAGCPKSSIVSFTSQLTPVSWLAQLFAPAVVLLFIFFGMISCLKCSFAEGLLKVLIGLALLVILSTIGGESQTTAKAFIAVVSGIVWFGIELRTADDAGR